MMMLAPTIQITARTMLTMMLDEGSGLLSMLSRWRIARAAMRATMMVAAPSTTVQKICWTRGFVANASRYSLISMAPPRKQ